jgi:tricorn protease
VLTARGRVTWPAPAPSAASRSPCRKARAPASAVFSHDDKWVYAIVDTTGENEIWRYAADGSGHGER